LTNQFHCFSSQYWLALNAGKMRSSRAFNAARTVSRVASLPFENSTDRVGPSKPKGPVFASVDNFTMSFLIASGRRWPKAAASAP
jgi:hypothetical protein